MREALFWAKKWPLYLNFTQQKRGKGMVEETRCTKRYF